MGMLCKAPYLVHVVTVVVDPVSHRSIVGSSCGAVYKCLNVQAHVYFRLRPSENTRITNARDLSGKQSGERAAAQNRWAVGRGIRVF